MSPGYPGSSSDRAIVASSGILDVILPGQRILADRGFKIQDLVARKRAFVSMPAFMERRNQLSGEEALQSRLIASGRIHVERAFGRLREFRILNSVQANRQKRGIVDDEMVVCAALVNLQSRLITEKL